MNWNLSALAGNAPADICHNVLWLVCSCRHDLHIRDLDATYLEELSTVMFVNIALDINDTDVM